MNILYTKKLKKSNSNRRRTLIQIVFIKLNLKNSKTGIFYKSESNKNLNVKNYNIN